MYAGPIVRTYYSINEYTQGAQIMNATGYRVQNIETHNVTHGLLLTLMLIFGLLLTPVCVGIVILCFLPLAFSKRYNVTYVPQFPSPPVYSQPLLPAAYSQPLYQPIAYSQPLYQPIAYSQPLMPPIAPPVMPPMPPAQIYQTPPSAPLYTPLPAYQAQGTSLGARFNDGLASLQQIWNDWTFKQRALAILGVVGLALIAIAVAIIVFA